MTENFYAPKPKKLQIDITSKCNSRCPQCPRTFKSTLRETQTINQQDMDITTLRRVLEDPWFSDVKSVFLNGNYGDFIMHSDPYGVIELINEFNIGRIKIHTNGGALPTEFWTWLGTNSNTIVEFAIDGLADTHSLYRRNTRFDVVLRNAKSYIDAGGFAIWQMVSFAHNEHQIEACNKMAIENGFHQFNVQPSPRWATRKQFVYNADLTVSHELAPASSVIDSVRESPYDVVPLTPADLDLLYEHEKLSINTNDPKLPETDDYIDCHAQREHTVYLGADGRIWPCCWMETDVDSGFRNNKPKTVNWHFHNKKELPLGYNSIKLHNMDEILASGLFDDLNDMIKTNTCDTCRMYCSSTNSVNKDFKVTEKRL